MTERQEMIGGIVVVLVAVALGALLGIGIEHRLHGGETIKDMSAEVDRLTIEARTLTKQIEENKKREDELLQQVSILDTLHETVTETKPDGTRLVIIRERGHEVKAKKQEKTTEVATKTENTQEQVKTVVQEKIVERIKEVTSRRPDWLIGVQAGTRVFGASDGLALPYNGVVGVSIDRRILGPAYVSAWGNTSGSVGLGLRLEF